MNGQVDDDGYVVSAEQRARFQDDGWIHLPEVLDDAEVESLAVDYDRFIDREIPVAGHDYCDMAGDYGRRPEDYSIINVMLPRRYFPDWQGNVYERRAASIAGQLCGPGMVIDYDQLLAKQPFKDDAVFAWHQDLAYWPETADTRTATCWLAIDHSTVENGCMRFVPATNRESSLRSHLPVLNSRGESHALGTELRPDDIVVNAPIRRGDITVHNERVMHGSSVNATAGRRRAYVVAFRAEETVRIERELGFTHSHNDDATTLAEVGVEGETR